MLPDEARLEALLGEMLGVRLHVALARAPTAPSRLSRGERAVFEKLGATPRARSWLVGRAALKRLRSMVDGAEDTADLRFPHPRFSLAHSGDVAVAVCDASRALAGLGVDLEIARSVHPGTARFFLTARERLRLDRTPQEPGGDRLLRAWCAKEAVFKANPDNAGLLLADHELASPGAARGEARFGARRLFDYASWSAGGTCVTAAVCRRRETQ